MLDDAGRGTQQYDLTRGVGRAVLHKDLSMSLNCYGCMVVAIVVHKLLSYDIHLL